MIHPVEPGTFIEYTTRRPTCPHAEVVIGSIEEAVEINGFWVYRMNNGKTYPQEFIKRIIKNDENKTC